MQRVFETGRHQQTDTGALAFENRIGRDRGAVEDRVDVGRADAGLFADEFDARRDADRLIFGRGRGFCLERAPTNLVVQQQVREGPAHVDTQSHRNLPRGRRHAHPTSMNAYATIY